tara:strand:- start:4967 stop:5311 length:345 start_codon:yes stop_codon:yes gene_type:complete
MSRRSASSGVANPKVEALQKELADLKIAAIEASTVESSAEQVASHEFDKLGPNEQAAASLGVHPESWKPISFMNNKHYDQLKRANALDDDLARRIEAYRSIASGGAQAAVATAC